MCPVVTTSGQVHDAHLLVVGQPDWVSLLEEALEVLDEAARGEVLEGQGCQIAKFVPFLSLDCTRVEGVGAQSKENFAIWQPRLTTPPCHYQRQK